MEKHEDILVALRKVIRAIDIHSKQLNKQSGLTGPQLIILQEIGRMTGITASQVAKNINLSAATVTSILDRLEAKNMVTRTRSQQDKRRVSLSLTDTGKQALYDAPQPLQEHFLQKFAELQEWEQSMLLASVQRLASMMDAENLDAAPMLELEPIVKSQQPKDLK